MLGHNLSHINPTRQRGPCDGNQIACKLIKDESAHDLDIEPLKLLESFLVDDLGAVLLISHDRGLPNDVVTSALVIEDDGLIREHEESYETDRRQRPGEPVSRSRPDSEVPTKKPADIPRKQSRKLS